MNLLQFLFALRILFSVSNCSVIESVGEAAKSPEPPAEQKIQILSHAIEGSQARYDNLIHTLQGCLDVVTANRNELLPEEEDASSGQAKQETTAAEPATQEAPANEIPEE